MTKLHELLAVESDLASRAQKDLKRIKELFAQSEKFIARVRTYRPLEDGGQPQPDEITNLSTTVSKEVASLRDSFGDWLDVSLQKEITNQSTKADVIVGDKTIIENMPAPALLNLEAKLNGLKSVLTAIPTNDTTERWEWDGESEAWVSEPRVTYSTKKVPKTLVAYEATPEHAAQVQVYNEDIRVGEWTTVIRSGMIKPSRKREILARLDKLIMAVKTARQRANQQEVDTKKIAADLLTFIWE